MVQNKKQINNSVVECLSNLYKTLGSSNPQAISKWQVPEFQHLTSSSPLELIIEVLYWKLSLKYNMNARTEVIIALCKILWELTIWRLKLLKPMLTELSLGIIPLLVFITRALLSKERRKKKKEKKCIFSVMAGASRGQLAVWMHQREEWTEALLHTISDCCWKKKTLTGKGHPGLKGAKTVTHCSSVTIGGHTFNIQKGTLAFKLLIQFYLATVTPEPQTLYNLNGRRQCSSNPLHVSKSKKRRCPREASKWARWTLPILLQKEEVIK